MRVESPNSNRASNQTRRVSSTRTSAPPRSPPWKHTRSTTRLFSSRFASTPYNLEGRRSFGWLLHKAALVVSWSYGTISLQLMALVAAVILLHTLAHSLMRWKVISQSTVRGFLSRPLQSVISHLPVVFTPPSCLHRRHSWVCVTILAEHLVLAAML